MKRILLSIAILTGSFSMAQNDVNSTAFNAWTGYMNVFDLSMNYQFGSGWGVSDLKSDVDSTLDQITLYPNFNTYADNPTDPYWVDQTSGAGQKIMEASTFVEPAGFNGQDLTFRGTVQSNTLDAGYTAKYFIKALDPANGYQDALGGSKVFDIPASGDFSVTATGAELASGLIIQFGFSVMGVNANPADEQTLGNIVITPSTASITSKEVTAFAVYPNPANEVLNISNGADFSDFQITSLDGKNVSSGSFNGTSVNVNDLLPGVYFITLKNKNDLIETTRFVKK